MNFCRYHHGLLLMTLQIKNIIAVIFSAIDIIVIFIISILHTTEPLEDLKHSVAGITSIAPANTNMTKAASAISIVISSLCPALATLNAVVSRYLLMFLFLVILLAHSLHLFALSQSTSPHRS